MVQIVMELGKVTENEARKISNFIDCFLDIDWSEATTRKIKSTIKEAQSMMSNPLYADMVQMAENAK